MPIEYENNSPAIRFLDRGQHLMRLQGRVLKPIMKATEAEHEDVKATVISPNTDMKEFVRATMARMKNSQERWEDIDLMFQLFFCRYVDNFQIFLEELIGDAVRHNPELVEGIKLRKADDSLPADKKLERRIRKLAFMSLTELTDILREQMNFRLFPTPVDASRVAYLYDIRNLITHNYGVVDEHFLERHPDIGVTAGNTFPLSPEFIHKAFDSLTDASGYIQSLAQTRFGLFYRTTVKGQVEWWEK